MIVRAWLSTMRAARTITTVSTIALRPVWHTRQDCMNSGHTPGVLETPHFLPLEVNEANARSAVGLTPSPSPHAIPATITTCQPSSAQPCTCLSP